MDGKDFKAARIKLGMTQVQIGNELGITDRMVRLMEAGEKPVSSRTKKGLEMLKKLVDNRN